MKTLSTERHSLKDFGRLLGLLRPHRALFAVGMGGLLIGGAVNLILPEVIRRFLNVEASVATPPSLWPIAITFIGLFSLQGVTFYIRSYCFGAVGQKVVADLRKQLHSRILSREISFYDRTRVGELVSRVIADSSSIQDALTFRLSVLIRYAFQVAVGIILMFRLSFSLTVFVALVVPVLVGFSIVLGRRLRRLSKLQQSELADASSRIEEAYSNIRIVKAFQTFPLEVFRFSQHADSIEQIGIARSRVAAFFSSFVSFLMNISLVAVLLYGYSRVLTHELPLGDLTAFLLYGLIVGVSFAFLAGSYGELMQAIGASERIFELIESTDESEEQTPLPSIPTSGIHPPQIQIRELRFAYPTRSETNALEDINLSIPPGSSVAIVGRSGAGKSTLFQLLLRFYTPTSGALLFDGKDAEHIALPTLRSFFGLVPQDPFFFHSSLRENLLYANRDSSEQDLFNVLSRVHLGDFVQSLPHGLETEIGERGIQLSGGQKQRLSLARVLLRNAPILLLDEATSSLDSESERYIQEALREAMKGRTTLCIAHRLSTIQNFKQVVVLDQGKIVETGTHESLLQKKGLYAHMVELQLLGEASSPQERLVASGELA